MLDDPNLVSESNNMFDNLLVISVPKNTALANELTHYLLSPTTKVADPLLWWVEKKNIYSCLSHMALNYLSIPGMCYFIFLFILI